MCYEGNFAKALSAAKDNGCFVGASDTRPLALAELLPMLLLFLFIFKLKVAFGRIRIFILIIKVFIFLFSCRGICFCWRFVPLAPLYVLALRQYLLDFSFIDTLL
jgi:hypothetical protein